MVGHEGFWDMNSRNCPRAFFGAVAKVSLADFAEETDARTDENGCGFTSARQTTSADAASPRVARAFSLAMQPLDKNIEKGNKSTGKREEEKRGGSRGTWARVDQLIHICATAEHARSVALHPVFSRV